MKRRDFLKSAGLGIAVLWAGALPSAEPLGRRPNIVLIYADDLGIGDLGCYGQRQFTTPNIDRLANEGTRFTNFYAGSTVSAPSRCAMLTGLHTGHCTRRDNRSPIYPKQIVPLRAEDYTFAKMLKQGGYTTACVGKWGLGDEGTTGTPQLHGFDHFFGYLDQVHSHSYYPEYLWLDGTKVFIPGNAESRDVYSHDLFFDHAMDFLEENAEKPFFLYMAVTLPHARFEVPSLEEFKDKSWPEADKAYAAMVTRLDDTVGRVIEQLDKLGLTENTLVMFTSDNGPLDRFNKTFNSASGRNSGKMSLREGGIRVPMIARMPGTVPQARVDDTLWWQVDFFATIASFTGLKPPPGIDSADRLPLLLGQTMQQPQYLYWENYMPFQQAIRMGQWKALRYGTLEPIELYDLSEDPSELTDVSKSHEDIVTRMKQIFEEARTPSEWWKPLPHPEKKRNRSRPATQVAPEEI